MSEREIKLASTPQFELPDLTGLVAGLTVGTDETTELTAQYFDTGDLRLTRAGMSLRFRPPEGWTVKTATSRSGIVLDRDEHVIVAPGRGGGPNPKPPERALDLARAWSRTAEIVPIAEMITRRRLVELRAADGTAVVQVTDDHVSGTHGGEPFESFREIEVELLGDADEDVARRVVRALRKAGAGKPEPVTKIVRALGPAARGRPDIRIVAANPRSATRTLIRSRISRHVAAIVANDPGVRLGDDVEFVHQMRVAARRFRSDLQSFGPALDRDWAGSLGREVGWLCDELGSVRDTEVLLDLLTRHAERLPERDRATAARLLRRLSERRGGRRDDLLVTLRSERYLTLLDRLVEAARSPLVDLEWGDRKARKVAPLLVDRSWRKLRKAVRTLPATPEPLQLHRVRILAKRTRYVAEAVAEVSPERFTRFAKRLGALQDQLGSHHDAVVAQQWLSREATLVGGTTHLSFVAGELAGLMWIEERRLLEAWRSVWDRVVEAAAALD